MEFSLRAQGTESTSGVGALLRVRRVRQVTDRTLPLSGLREPRVCPVAYPMVSALPECCSASRTANSPVAIALSPNSKAA